MNRTLPSQQNNSFFQSNIVGLLTLTCLNELKAEPEDINWDSVTKLLDQIIEWEPRCNSSILLYGAAGYLYSLLMVEHKLRQFLTKNYIAECA